MRILGNTALRRQKLSHGGCEVLRLELTEPQGKTAAADHLRALMAELEAYARGSILTKAVEELESLAKMGEAHRFGRHLYRATLQEQPLKSGICITLCISHLKKETSDERILFHKEIRTLWDETGTYQRGWRKKAP